MKPNTEQDFWAKVDKSGGPNSCWEWQGFCTPTRNGGGYGRFGYQGKAWQAHRLALLFSGVDITGKLACHHCDNRRCCNPAHLYAGDSKSNAQDAKDRNRHWRGSGVKNPNAKLTDEQVLDIRRLPYRQAVSKYGHIISTGHICSIKYQKHSWKHI